MTKVNENSTVTVHYTGKLEDGSIFDTSHLEGRTPLNVKLGEGALIPGFEKGLLDMEVGQNKTIEIEPDQAYGEFNPEMIGEVTKDKVPSEIEVGHTLQTMTPQGPLNVRVIEIKEETVVLDANHPLAGKKLIFDLELVSLS
jgi:FKBP-type peptidyl-prolyl cis-trans isomerase SlpA